MLQFDQFAVDMIAVEFHTLGHRMKKGDEAHIPTSHRRFRQWYGVSPTVASKCWLLLTEDEEFDDSTRSKQHLLWALLLMKNYGNIETLASMAGTKGVDEKTFTLHAWNYVVHISDLQGEVIVFDNRLIGDIGNDCTISVDGVDFWKAGRIKLNGWNDSSLYSHKFKASGLRYEIGLSILGNYIVWLNGPFLPGVLNDLSVFRSGLKQQLMAVGKRCEADDGYMGECPRYTLCPGHISSEHSRQRLKHRVGLRQESLNERFKNFECMVTRFRHSATKHSACFHAIAVLTQLALESGEELFDAREYNDANTDDYIRNNLTL